MKRKQKYIGTFLLAGALALPLATVGCAEHRYYRADDPYHHDYHRWDNNEVVYYNQWSLETHRDSQRDYRRLNKDEQKEYWNWRHNHHDFDHDHDHEHR